MAQETLITESDVPRYLDEFIELALTQMENSDFASGLSCLNKSEELLEAIAVQGGFINPDYILVTLHNTACCHQKLGQLEEAASYLDGCAYNAKTRKTGLEGDATGKVSAHRIKKYRYQAKVRIQLCAILSQLNKHEAAQYHARKAAKYVDKVIVETHKVCSEHLKRHKKLMASGRIKSKAMERPQYQLMESPHYQQFHDAVLKTFPILESLIQRLGPKKKSAVPKAPRLDMRSVLGVQHYNDWIYSYNISDLMVIDPMELGEFDNDMGLQAELTKDIMLEKLSMLSVAYFCVASEIRFIHSQNGGNAVKEKEGEAWHAKALQLVKDFLPLECPLAAHIKQSYVRNYGEVLTATVKKTRGSVRQMLEGSVRGRKAQNLEKSPLAVGRTKEIVKEIMVRARSSSGQKKSTPKKRLDISPKPTSTRVNHQVKRFPGEEKSVKTVEKKEEESSEKESFGLEEVVGGVMMAGEKGVGGRERTAPTEEDEEIVVETVKAEGLEDDPESEESYRDQIIISSNELYGDDSDNESSPPSEDSWEDHPSDPPKDKRFEQFRPISSTGGHN